MVMMILMVTMIIVIVTMVIVMVTMTMVMMVTSKFYCVGFSMVGMILSERDVHFMYIEGSTSFYEYQPS